MKRDGMSKQGSAIGPFDPKEEDMGMLYIEHVELYFEAKGITDAAKKRVTLLTTCGPKTYCSICNLTAPATPTSVGYNDIVSLMKEHYNLQLKACGHCPAVQI